MNVVIEELNETTTRCTVEVDGSRLSAGDALHRMSNEREFREALIDVLRGSPFDAFFWESPPLTRDTLDHPFEFVLCEAPGLARVQAEPGAFGEHFADRDDSGIVVFENLGGDATLIVPCPLTLSLTHVNDYTHLANFVRRAESHQVDALFQRVAVETSQRLGARPLWLSTAGMGVYWLHVRLDSRPKYYRFAPYKNPARSCSVMRTRGPVQRSAASDGEAVDGAATDAHRLDGATVRPRHSEQVFAVVAVYF